MTITQSFLLQLPELVRPIDTTEITKDKPCEN